MKTAQKLSRQELFERTCKEMESNGFEQKPLILPAKKLNIIAFLLIVPLLAVTIFLFLLRWNSLLEKHPEIIAITPMFFVCFLASIFIHELIHGLTWSCFCPDRFHSIHFGFQLKTLTPYCHCAQPLKKFPYLLGTLMPCLILGIGTYLLSLLIPNFSLALFGAMNIAAAIGDLAISFLLIPQKDVLVVDHPTEPGLIAFFKV